MVAVIAGATGLTGSVLLRNLLADVEIDRVVSVSRRSVGFRDPRLDEVLICDLDQLRAQSARLKGNLYFSCLGTTIKTAGSPENFCKVDYDAVLAFATLAKSHEAHFFGLISATGADPESRIFYNRVKGKSEEAVRSLGLTQLVIFRPGLLVGARTERRTTEKLALTGFAIVSPLLPAALRRSMATPVEILAEIMWREGKKTHRGTRVLTAREIHL